MLQFFSATTSVVDSKRAIAECLEKALAGENSLDCDLLIIYTAMGHNFRDLLSEAHRLSPGAQVVGCTCAGIIGNEGPDESLKALAVMAIKGPKNEFAVTGGILSPHNSDAFRIGSRMAQDLKSKCSGINMIFFHPNSSKHFFPEKIIEGIESVFGPDVPIIGGASIDNMKLISNFQFLGEQVFEQEQIMFGLADPTLEVVSHANHGFEIVGDPFIVTKTEKGKIVELDGKPAWTRWTERLGLPDTSSAADVIGFAPLAIELSSELHEEYGSRYLVNAGVPNPDKSIWCMIEVPEGGKLWLTRRNESKIHDGVERLLIQILDRCAGRKPVAVFHADCAARGKLTFNRIIKEEIISQLQYPICRGENIPWLGMYGGGEYTPLAGKNRIHAYTTSLYVIVKRDSEIKEEKVKRMTDIVKESRLFEKTTIKNINLKNRFISSATWHGMANFDGSASSMLISSLLPLARGDVGLMIGEMAYVSPDTISSPGQLGVYGDNLRPGLKRMTEFVHREGTPVILQLVHSGLFSSPLLSGATPIGPSVLETPYGKIGKEMSKEDIGIVIKAFRDAALRAKEADFDGVQIHAAHGWLLSQFLSSFFNKRTDEYGGTLENRAKILMEVTRNIIEAVGENFAVTVKINSDDWLPGGFKTEEMIAVSEMLEKEGVDAIEISGGTIGALLTGNVDGSFSPVSRKEVYYTEAARRLKEKIKIPVILVGGIRTFEKADELVKNGIADYISLCRPLIREPDLIKKWKSGNLKKSDCISDSACFQPGVEGKGVHCVHLK
ncbi:MAG: FIST C-terminal domain-containing protein [Bacteroidales bacterium]|nr:FIST C-terminal domain-containing protein [Bacteroidales bacterium]